MSGRLRLGALAAVLLAVGLLAAASASHLSAWRFISSASPQGEPTSWSVQPQDGPALVIFAPGMGQLLLEKGTLPPLSGRGHRWSGALVNVRSGGGSSPEDAMATVSAGKPAFGVGNLIVSAEQELPWTTAGPSARSAVAKWYEVEVPSGGAAVVDFGRLQQMQDRLSWQAAVGRLGASYRDAGMATAYLAASAFDSSAALAAADTRGLIDHYFPPPRCTQPAAVPGGLQTSWSRVADILTSLPGEVGLAVLQIGDFRAITDRGDWLPHDYRTRRAGETFSALGQMTDTLLGDWASIAIIDPLRLPESGMGLMLLTSAEQNLATSATTRRPGMVSLGDIGEAMTAGGLPPQYSRPERIIRFSSALPEGSLHSALDRLDRTVGGARNLRYPLARGTAIYVIMCMMAMAVTLYWWPRWYPVAVANMAAAALLPPAAILTPAMSRFVLGIDAPSTGGLLLAWVTMAVLCAGIYLLCDVRSTILAVAWLVALLVAADQLTGGRWALLSPLGYCPAAGARYYGLGNEFLGIFLGAVLLIVALSRRLPFAACGPDSQSLSAPGWGFLFLVGALVCGPSWGNNFGGGLTVVCWLAASVGSNLHQERGRRTGKLLYTGVITLIVLAAVGILLLWHIRSSEPAVSHIGRVSENLWGGNYSHILDIVGRKVETGIRVFRSTVWTRIWLFGLGIFALVSYRPPRSLNRLFCRRSRLRFLSRTAAAVSAAALLLNDSGVVTAALMMMGPVTAVMLAAGEELSVGEEN